MKDLWHFEVPQLFTANEQSASEVNRELSSGPTGGAVMERDSISLGIAV